MPTSLMREYRRAFADTAKQPTLLSSPIKKAPMPSKQTSRITLLRYLERKAPADA